MFWQVSVQVWKVKEKEEYLESVQRSDVWDEETLLLPWRKSKCSDKSVFKCRKSKKKQVYFESVQKSDVLDEETLLLPWRKSKCFDKSVFKCEKSKKNTSILNQFREVMF